MIGVGAPSYTSGTHIWKGTTAILKPRPATRKTIASTTAARVSSLAAATTFAMSSRLVLPDSPKRRAMPYRVTAVLRAPSRRYLRPASLERMSLRKATRMYSEILVSSRTTKMAMRSTVAARSIMPAAETRMRA